MSGGVFTIYDNIEITVYCADCKAPETGKLGIRVRVIDGVPGFEFAVCNQVEDEFGAHNFAAVRLDSIAGIQALQMHRPGKDPAGRN